MPREKKYTKTIAFRVTAEEWAAIEEVIRVGAPIMEPHPVVPKRPSDVVRAWIAQSLQLAIEHRQNAIKREEARAKRAEAAAKRLKESRGQ